MIEEKLKENEQFELYHESRIATCLHILGKMESEGIKVNIDTLETNGEELEEKI